MKASSALLVLTYNGLSRGKVDRQKRNLTSRVIVESRRLGRCSYSATSIRTTVGYDWFAPTPQRFPYVEYSAFNECIHSSCFAVNAEGSTAPMPSSLPNDVNLFQHLNTVGRRCRSCRRHEQYRCSPYGFTARWSRQDSQIFRSSANTESR